MHAPLRLLFLGLLALPLAARGGQAPPVLLSNVDLLTVIDGEEIEENSWRLSPELDPDIYEAKLVSGQKHTVIFRSDQGEIRFEVELGKEYDFVVRWQGRDCHTRIVGTEFVPAAAFDEAYRAAHRGKIVVEVPEAYELANIAIAMTPTGIANGDLVFQRSGYYREMRAWFDRFRDQPVLEALDAELRRDSNRYFTLKMNGASFEFDAKGRLVQSPVYDRTGFTGDRVNHLRPFLSGLQQFADASDFRGFYRQHLEFYTGQIRFFQEEADLPGMLAWLKAQFPASATYDGYKVIFSPLVAYNQSATWFKTAGYSELQAHVNFPYVEDLARFQGEPLTPESALLFRGNIVFTELNHGFINPEADRYATRVKAAVADHDFWVDAAKGPNYYSGMAAFNEYMNWALVSVRYVDVAPEKERAAMTERIDRMMVQSRGFRRFREFDTFLIDLYRHRPPGSTVADLYPQILDWFERLPKAAATAPAAPPVTSSSSPSTRSRNRR